LKVLFAPQFIMILFPVWSLSVEAIYYLCAPVLVRSRHVTLLGAIAGSGFLMMVWPFFAKSDYTLTPYGTEILTFGWAWLTGWMADRHPRNWPAYTICVLAGWGVCLTHPVDLWMVNWRVAAFTYVAWTATVSLLFFHPSIEIPDPARRLLLYLGDLSFPLYVAHYPVLFIMTTAIWHAHPDLNHGLVQVAISLIVAHLVLVLIDRPMRVLASPGHRLRSIEAAPRLAGR
jgi:peptidoglycan/LPS O-acetylase OafA/YrhL